jgi:hypothetical protein
MMSCHHHHDYDVTIEYWSTSRCFKSGTSKSGPSFKLAVPTVDLGDNDHMAASGRSCLHTRLMFKEKSPRAFTLVLHTGSLALASRD